MPKLALFLDDMQTRHEAFLNLIDGATTVYSVYTAEDAIVELESVKFDVVFLDHDLSEEDIMCDPGSTTSKVKTGMAVVDHILTMVDPPHEVYVHTCNTPASFEMVKRLESHPNRGMVVTRLPFPYLIHQMKINKEQR